MTDEKPAVPWGQTTAGILVIQGIVTAVVSALVTWLINQAQGLDPAQLALTFVIVLVVVFLLVSLFVPRVRRAVYVAPFKWLSGLRVSTRRGRETVSGAFEAKVNERAKQIIADMEPPKPSSAELSRMSAEVNQRDATIILQTQRIGELTAERDALQQEVDDARGPHFGLPSPEPRWKIIERGWTDPDPESPFMERKYALANIVPESVALNVRLEDNGSLFDFSDAGFWRDLSGEAEGWFAGTLIGQGRTDGVSLMLSWLDEDHETRTQWIRVRSHAEQTKDEQDDSPF